MTPRRGRRTNGQKSTRTFSSTAWSSSQGHASSKPAAPISAVPVRRPVRPASYRSRRRTPILQERDVHGSRERPRTPRRPCPALFHTRRTVVRGVEVVTSSIGGDPEEDREREVDMHRRLGQPSRPSQERSARQGHPRNVSISQPTFERRLAERRKVKVSTMSTQSDLDRR
jgi:hypothetical protein